MNGNLTSFQVVPADTWYIQFPDGYMLPVVGFGMFEDDEEGSVANIPVTLVAYFNGIEIAEETLDRPWHLITKGWCPRWKTGKP